MSRKLLGHEGVEARGQVTRS
ncbi:Protein of unknown function [Bacillus mycoides]|nr:Protein of unknown function [Bacillus mycoides]